MVAQSRRCSQSVHHSSCPMNISLMLVARGALACYLLACTSVNRVCSPSSLVSPSNAGSRATFVQTCARRKPRTLLVAATCLGVLVCGLCALQRPCVAWHRTQSSSIANKSCSLNSSCLAQVSSLEDDVYSLSESIDVLTERVGALEQGRVRPSP